MRKVVSLIAFFLIQHANCQTYLISFTAKGESNTIANVKVENLTKGTTLTLSGDDVLRLNQTTNLRSVDINQSSLKIYPNPMNSLSTIEITAPETGDGVLSIIDIGGKAVIQFPVFIENRTQNFKISGLEKGFYIINVTGKNYRSSCKFSVMGNSTRNVKIEKLVNTQPVGEEKKSKAESKGLQNYVDMAYASGERMKFTGMSGIYSTVITDIPTSDETILFKFVECTDGDNSNYPVVPIGSQIWMGENLKTTRYSNGDLIGTTNPPTKDISDESSPKYQWAFNGIENNAALLGRLYTWYATIDNRNICPAGWHVPTRIEWYVLFDFLGGIVVAGDKLKPKNESGFTALGAGARTVDGIFYSGNGWWSSTNEESGNTWRYTISAFPYVYEAPERAKSDGFSVRCVKGGISISTASVISVSSTTAQSGGNIFNNGGLAISFRGVCWSISRNPTIGDNHTSDGTGTGSYSSMLTGLTGNTRYFLRAYATNGEGTYYGDEIIYVTKGESNSIMDTEGNNYSTIEIGTQTWMADNLKSTRYLNGDLIPTTPDATDISSEIAPKYQWAYAGDESNVATYGRLYTWYAVSDSRKLCPTGWHVPSDAEWTILTDYLGGMNKAGGKLKESGTVHWMSPNTGATNETGFNALPGGIRNYTGSSSSITGTGRWWTSSPEGTGAGEERSLHTNSISVYSDFGVPARFGFSLRCLKDN